MFTCIRDMNTPPNTNRHNSIHLVYVVRWKTFARGFCENIKIKTSSRQVNERTYKHIYISIAHWHSQNPNQKKIYGKCGFDKMPNCGKPNIFLFFKSHVAHTWWFVGKLQTKKTKKTNESNDKHSTESWIACGFRIDWFQKAENCLFADDEWLLSKWTWQTIKLRTFTFGNYGIRHFHNWIWGTCAQCTMIELISL